MQSEGPRGHSARAAVWSRHAGYFAVIAVCSALTEGFTAHIPVASHAGVWMFLASTIMVLACTIGGFGRPVHRAELAEQLRHYLFGMVVGPGTGIALVMWVTMGQLSQNTTSTFATLMTNAMPIIFFVTILMPTLVYIKLVSGLRTIYRSTMDDQEMLHIWTRQTDGLQR